MLEYCTDKLNLPFAARRVFLEDGVEVFTEKDIPVDSEVYISTGENYKDPYATTKRNNYINFNSICCKSSYIHDVLIFAILHESIAS